MKRLLALSMLLLAACAPVKPVPIVPNTWHSGLGYNTAYARVLVHVRSCCGSAIIDADDYTDLREAQISVTSHGTGSMYLTGGTVVPMTQNHVGELFALKIHFKPDGKGSQIQLSDKRYSELVKSWLAN